MCNELEFRNYSHMNPFPCCTSLVPGFVKIDTLALVEILMEPYVKLSKRQLKHGQQSKSYCATHIVEMKSIIWEKFCHTQRRVFRYFTDHRRDDSP
jgi:hypothetical protein